MAALFIPTLLQGQEGRAIIAASVPALIQEAVRYQLEDLHHEGWALRYRVHRVDSKEDSVRDLVESSEGNVARTLVLDGKPLSPEQDAEEEQRLRSLTAEGLARHRRGGDSTNRYGTELISAMPQAMVYTTVPEQPQLPQFQTGQVVLDFAPNPAYKPSTTAQALLSGLAGRLWVDRETHHLLRIEVRVTKDLTLALGLLARVYKGGSMIYEQQRMPNGHDAYRHIEIDVTLRELMVKTVPYHSTLDAKDVVVLPAVPSFQQAVALLLTGGESK